MMGLKTWCCASSVGSSQQEDSTSLAGEFGRKFVLPRMPVELEVDMGVTCPDLTTSNLSKLPLHGEPSTKLFLRGRDKAY